MPAADGSRLPREQRPAGDPRPARAARPARGSWARRRRAPRPGACGPRPQRPAMTIGTGLSECAVIGLAVGRAQRVGVAVVGGDRRAARPTAVARRAPRAADDPPEARVDRLDGADRRVPVARVADHVRVREVRDERRRTRPTRCPPPAASVTPGALISGWRSYVATFGLGTRIRSSFGNGASRPPFRKYVTCAYFSVSATWSWRQPASATAPARQGTTSGGNATVDRQVGLVLGHRHHEQVGAAPADRPAQPGRSASNVPVRQRVDELARPVGAEVRVDDRLADRRAGRRPGRRARSMTVGGTNSSPMSRAYAASIASVALGACSPTPWTIAS